MKLNNYMIMQKKLNMKVYIYEMKLYDIFNLI